MKKPANITAACLVTAAILTAASASDTYAQDAAVEMTKSVTAGSVTYYYAAGTETDTFTVNGNSVEATPVNAAKTLFKYCETAPETPVYGIADIPYADFFYGEMNEVKAPDSTLIDPDSEDAAAPLREEGYYDCVTSATTRKWSGHDSTFKEINEDGTGKIYGVQTAVEVSADLYANALIMNAEGLSCRVTDILSSISEAGEILQEAPAAYKTIYADGTLSAVQTENKEERKEAEIEYKSASSWGDHELDFGAPVSEDTVLGAIVKTEDGAQYAMLHNENLWRMNAISEIAWSCGETVSEPHGNTLRYKPYEDMAGKTIDSIKFYTDNGTIEYTSLGIRLKEKFGGTMEVDDADIKSGKTSVTMSELPEGYDPVVYLELDGETLEEAAYDFEAKTLTYPEGLLPGDYVLRVDDESGTYASMFDWFLMTSDEIPVVYDEDSKKLVSSGNDLLAAHYLGYISEITVKSPDKTEAVYSGWDHTVIAEDGALNTDAESEGVKVFPESGEYELTLSAYAYTGELTFNVTIE